MNELLAMIFGAMMSFSFGLAFTSQGNIWLFINYGIGLVMASCLMVIWNMFHINTTSDR